MTFVDCEEREDVPCRATMSPTTVNLVGYAAAWLVVTDKMTARARAKAEESLIIVENCILEVLTIRITR